MEVEQKLLELLTPENIQSIVKFVRLVRRLDELGLIDTLLDLADSNVVEDLVKAFTTTNLVTALMNIEGLLSLLGRLSRPETLNALSRLVEILEGVDKLGILGTVRDLAGDHDVLGDLIGNIINTNTVYALTSLGPVAELLTAIKYGEVARALANDLSKGLSGEVNLSRMLIDSLRDNDVKRGIAFMILAAKHLGRQLTNVQKGG